MDYHTGERIDRQSDVALLSFYEPWGDEVYEVLAEARPTGALVELVSVAGACQAQSDHRSEAGIVLRIADVRPCHMTLRAPGTSTHAPLDITVTYRWEDVTWTWDVSAMQGLCIPTDTGRLEAAVDGVVVSPNVEKDRSISANAVYLNRDDLRARPPLGAEPWVTVAEEYGLDSALLVAQLGMGPPPQDGRIQFVLTADTLGAWLGDGTVKSPVITWQAGC